MLKARYCSTQAVRSNGTRGTTTTAPSCFLVSNCQLHKKVPVTSQVPGKMVAGGSTLLNSFSLLCSSAVGSLCIKIGTVIGSAQSFERTKLALCRIVAKFNHKLRQVPLQPLYSQPSFSSNMLPLLTARTETTNTRRNLRPAEAAQGRLNRRVTGNESIVTGSSKKAGCHCHVLACTRPPWSHHKVSASAADSASLAILLCICAANSSHCGFNENGSKINLFGTLPSLSHRTLIS